MHTSNPAEPGQRAGARQWLGLAVLALPTILLSLDVTVLYLALPHLSADLNPNSTETLWIIDIYGFLIAGFLITMGNIGDRIGRRLLLMIGAVGFTAASVLAAYANSPEMLIVARALLGVFGASLMPSTLALISNMFLDSKQRAQAIAIWAACFSSGIAIGPLIGGALLEWFWWGSVFLLAVPVMVLLLVLGPPLLPEYRGSNVGKLDLLSSALSLAAVIPVIWGIKELSEDGWHLLPVIAVGAGLIFGVLFVMRQRGLEQPMLDIRLFRDRAFSAALVVLLVGVGLVGGVYLFISQYFQIVEALSPFEAGLWLLPSAFLLVVTASAAPSMLSLIRPGYLVGTGLLLSCVGYLVMMTVEPRDDLVTLVVGLGIMFAGLGPVFALGTDLVVGAAPPAKSGAAAAMSETAMELGLSLGIAIIGSIGTAIYRSRAADSLPADLPEQARAVAEDTLPGAVAVAAELPPELGGPVVDAAFSAFADGTGITAGVCAAIVGVLALTCFAFLRRVKTQAQIDAEAHTASEVPADTP